MDQGEFGLIVMNADEARAFTWRDSGSMEAFEEVEDFEAGVPTVRRTSPLNKWTLVNQASMAEFLDPAPPSWSVYERERALSDMEEVEVELALHDDDVERMQELVDAVPTPERPASWNDYARERDLTDMDEVEVALTQQEEEADRMNEFVDAVPTPERPASWNDYARERDLIDMDEVEVTLTQQEEEAERMAAFDDEVLAPPPLRSWKSYVRERELREMDEIEATEDLERMGEAPLAGAATWAEYIRAQELHEMDEIDGVEDKTRMAHFDDAVRFLSFTVTFHANLAHSLTCSP